MSGLLTRPVPDEAAKRWSDLGKQAATAPELSYGLAGRLYLSQSGWLLLSVPNSLGRGAFEALHEHGVELPEGPGGTPYNAHITVMRPAEIEQLGGPDKITERGKVFRYTLGPVRVVNPAGWDEMERCWFITVQSRELEKLRKSYGLSGTPKNGEHQFHITIGVRRRGVLQNNDVSKAAEAENVLFHGSADKLDTLEPRTDHCDPGIGPAVFATPSKAMALAYLQRWSDRDLAQGSRGFGNRNKSPEKANWHLAEMRPGALQEIYGGKSGYLHTLPAQTFTDRPDAVGSRWEQISTSPVKPTKVEHITDILQALQAAKVRMVPYDPKSPEFRGQINYAIQRLARMTPEDRASYLRWRAEAATPEVFAAFKRRGVTLPDQQKTAEAGKQASQPFYQRALNTQLQQPQWDANQSFLQNIAGNLQAAQQRGQRLVDQEDNFRSYLASQNPYAAAQQLAETAQSGQDPVVHNQLDQLLFRHRFAG